MKEEWWVVLVFVFFVTGFGVGIGYTMNIVNDEISQFSCMRK